MIYRSARRANPGPYFKTDWRSRLRRCFEGWMPRPLFVQARRVQMAIRFRERLRDVPKAAVPLHPAWFSQADMEHAANVARERGWADSEQKGGGDGADV